MCPLFLPSAFIVTTFLSFSPFSRFSPHKPGSCARWSWALSLGGILAGPEVSDRRRESAARPGSAAGPPGWPLPASPLSLNPLTRQGTCHVTCHAESDLVDDARDAKSDLHRPGHSAGDLCTQVPSCRGPSSGSGFGSGQRGRALDGAGGALGPAPQLT